MTASGNLGIAFLAAVGGILAARALGPEGRGEFAAAIVWASVLGTVAQLGLPQALTYYTALHTEAIGSIYKAMLLTCALQSFAILLLGWAAIQLILPEAQPSAVLAVRIYLMSIPLVIPVTYMATIAQGARQFKVFRTLRLGPSLVYVLVLGIALVLGLRNAAQVLYLLLAGHLVTLIWALGFFYLRLHPDGMFEWLWVRRLLKYGLKSFAGSLSWMANARIDQFIMSAFVSLKDLGQYAVAVSYAGVAFPLLSAVAMVIFPSVASGDRAAAGRKIAFGLAGTFIISCGTALILAILSATAIPFLFGAEFTPAAVPAKILLFGTIALGANYVLSDGLRGLGHPLHPSIAEVIGLVFTLIGLYLLLPRSGILGAAWASVISYGVTFLVLAVGAWRILGKHR